MPELCAFCIYKLGISRSDFYQLTLLETYLALKYKSDEENANLKIQRDLLRIQTYYLMKIQLSEDSELNSPSDLTLMNLSDEKIENKVEDEPPDWNSLKNMRG